jgi:hypothetical protein
MLAYEARSTASPAAAWALLARPARWSEWAPHVRGAWRLGDPEVRDGARGYARLFGAVPVPARITAKEPGRSWTWSVAGVRMVHRVERRRGGCTVAVDLHAASPVEAALRISYGPLVSALVRRLARVAERD